MTSIKNLEKRIDGYISEGNLYKESQIDVLSKYHLEKARHNILVSRLMFELSENDTYKKAIPIISKEFICYDWVISSSYYSMFHASTAAIAAIGLKARSHEALIYAIEYYLHYKKQALSIQHVKKFKSAKTLESKYINSLWSAKTSRNIAHYDTGRSFSEKEARDLIKTAIEYLDRIETFISEIL